MKGKEQTAVEWLKDQLECFGNKHELTISWTTVDNLVEQAKATEKEQIVEAFKHAKHPPLFVNFDAEEYYNYTFKSE